MLDDLQECRDQAGVWRHACSFAARISRMTCLMSAKFSPNASRAQVWSPHSDTVRAMRLFFHQNRLEPPLEEMTDPVMPTVIRLGVAPIERATAPWALRD
jgi:hypothetical protein